MNRLLVPLAALVAGFAWGFAVAGVGSLLFALLPPMAFAVGYFSNWRRGLLRGFLLFAGYTFGLSLIWWGPGSPNLLYPIPYVAAFIAGGFSLPLISFLAPAVRRGFGQPSSITALTVLAVATGWSGYAAMPHYSYYYQVVVQSSEDLTGLELYLPAGGISGRPYEQLYRRPFRVPGELTEDFTAELMSTEQGIMLRLAIPALKKDNVPVPRYTANVIFREERAPRQSLQLMPRTDIVPVNSVSFERYVGPIKSRESLILERFQVPVKVAANKQGQVKLTLWNRTDRSEAVHFGYTYARSYPYTERISYDLQTDGQWRLAPVEATSLLEVRGIGD